MKTRLTLLLAFICFVSCRRNTQNPGYDIEMLSDMKRPIPFEAYSTQPRAPVAGTVPRGVMIALPKSNPVPMSTAALSRGEEVYRNYCLVCHGSTGEGDGPLIPKYPNPPSYRQKRVMDLTAPELFVSITNGKRDMPSHAGQVTEEDRWKVIHYIEKLQGKK